jgi:peptidyl-dipeptidase A
VRILAKLLQNKEIGQYMRDKIFAPGNLYPWNELTKFATGEPLSPKYFVKQNIAQ